MQYRQNYKYNPNTVEIRYEYNTNTIQIQYKYNTNTIPIQYKKANSAECDTPTIQIQFNTPLLQ